MANYTLNTGKKITEEQNKLLSPAATMHDPNDKKEETYRTIFRRERDRILYSGGFRRLQDKTQVIAAYQGGDHRTRLTHTLEVEQIAVSIADALGLNRDLVSAIAIGHDVGHTPFGHSAERALNKLLEGQGGFSHAVQSVRYLCKRESESNIYDKEILKGILKHDTDVYAGGYDEKQFNCSWLNPEEGPSLEAQIVYWSDKIAYITHDFEDFYQNEIYYNMRKRFDKNEGKAIDVDKELVELLREIMPDMTSLSSYKTRNLIREILKNLIETSLSNINKVLESVENKKDSKLKNSDEMKKRTNAQIKDYEKGYIAKFLEAIKSKTNGNNSLSDEQKDILERFEEFISSIADEYKNIVKSGSFSNDVTNEFIVLFEKLSNEAEPSSNYQINYSKLFSDESDSAKSNKKQKSKFKNKISSYIKKEINSCKKKAFVNSLIINFDDEFRKHYLNLRNFLDKHYIFSPEVQRSDAYAKKVVTSLFNLFSENEKLLPLNIQHKIDENNSKARVIADYIASMSDRYAVDVYNNLNFAGNRYKL